MPRDDVSSAHDGLGRDRVSSRHRTGHLHALDPSGGIIDGAGNELLTFKDTANAVNNLELGNAATSKPVDLRAVGDDTNIGIHLIPKGDGKVRADRLYCHDADDTASPSRYLAVGASQDGMFYSVNDVVYLDGRTSNVSDLHLRINDGGTMKTLIELDADVALLKLGQDDADVTLGKLAQGTEYAFRPETTLMWDVGSSSFKFRDGYFGGDVLTDTVTGTSGVYTVEATDDVDDPPTAGQLNTAFGSGLADGFLGVLNDNNGDTDVWLCMRSNGSWFFTQLTAA